MTLLRYSVKRLLQAVVALLGITLITFLLVNLMPGDPVSIMLEDQTASEEVVRSLEERYGLDRPVHERYVSYMSGILQGDLGYSIHENAPVTSLIMTRIGPTLMLVLSAFVFAMVTAIPMGVFAAHRRNEPADHVSRVVGLVGVSTPSFWIGIMLIVLFAVELNWLPSARLVYPWRSPSHYGFDSQIELYVQAVRHLVLPTIALGTLQMATIMRIERTAMVESLQKEHVRLARAYGVPEWKILSKHAFRVAQLPIITIAGLNLSTALGGSVVIEQVFQINGMGTLLLDAIQQLDYQLVLGITLVLATIFIVGVLITDLAYAYIDPRVSYDTNR